MSRLVLKFLSVCAAGNSAFALAAPPLAFDCDVPANHFSSVSQEFERRSGSIQGVVQVREMRSGNNLPVAGARIVDGSAKSSLGFQLVASSPKAEFFDIILNKEVNGKLEKYNTGKVAVKNPAAFKLVVDGLGKANFIVDAIQINFDFPPLSGGKGMVFCSTGQFKFAEVVFEEGSTSVPQNRP